MILPSFFTLTEPETMINSSVPLESSRNMTSPSMCDLLEQRLRKSIISSSLKAWKKRLLAVSALIIFSISIFLLRYAAASGHDMQEFFHRREARWRRSIT